MRLNRKGSVQKMLKKIDPPGKDGLWMYVKDKFDIGMELRLPFEGRWILNLSFIAGRQYAYFNEATHLLQHLVHPKGRVRVVDNQILPRYQKQVSRLIRNNPRMSVVPASTDQEDIKAAKLADKVLKWFWRQHRMRKTIRQLGGWVYATGNCFMDDRWNPKLGPEAPNEDGVMSYLGDADVGIWSPFEVGFPTGGIQDQDIDTFPWMWKAKFRTLEYIAANYKRGDEVPAEKKPQPYVDSSMLFGLQRTITTREVDGAVVIELKVQPNVEFPKGLFCTAANGIVLEKEDYPFGSYHLEQFKDIEIPGVFWGMATTEAAIWLQKVWNRQVSDIAEFNRTMARGKWLEPRNSQMEVIPDDAHGQRIKYTPVMGHKPEMMDIKGLPSTYQQALQIVAGSLMELYHQHEVTQGTNKSDIRSGEMVALLLEQDDFGNVPTHAVFEESLEAVMSRVLMRIQKGYKDDRVIAITGRDLEHEVFNFKGADLRNNTDVHVLKESSLPDSKVARQLRITQNYEKGLYGSLEDERTRERVLQMLEEVPDDLRDIFAEKHLDRQNAAQENRNIMEQPSIEFMVNPYDDHATHLEEHRMAQKQPEYQRLKIENIEVFVAREVAFQKHNEMHSKFYAEQMNAQKKEMAEVIELKKKAGGGRA
jgi:hypothetical protein